MERRYIEWTDIERMVSTLLRRLPPEWDNLMVITRGGMEFPGDEPDFYAEKTDGWIVYPWDPSRPQPE